MLAPGDAVFTRYGSGGERRWMSSTKRLIVNSASVQRSRRRFRFRWRTNLDGGAGAFHLT
jgi:hypothetical protein